MILVKVGGGKIINWDYLCQDLAEIKDKTVLVHGANWQMDQICQKMGKTAKMVISPSGYTSRYTDQDTIELLLMAYAGLVNKQIVARLQKLGVNAVGLSGIDGRLWEGEWKKVILAQENGKTKAIRNNFQGRVTKVNHQLIKLLVNHGYLPVLTIPAISQEGQIINVDNDRAIAVTAKALKIKKLVVLFEAPGLLKDPKNPRSLIKKIQATKIDDYLQYAEGRMKKKILGAKEALAGGVETIYWADGRVRNPIQNALAGKGTIIQ